MSRHEIPRPEPAQLGSGWPDCQEPGQGTPCSRGSEEGLLVSLKATGNGSLGTHMEYGAGGTLRGKGWWPWHLPHQAEAPGTTASPTLPPCVQLPSFL